MSTRSRIHVALASKNLAESLEFYRGMFGQEPAKVREDYAKFELQVPDIHLSLNAFDGETSPRPGPQHFGVQVWDSDELAQWRARANQGKLIKAEEEAVTCCYAVSDKVWVVDPDGNKWEIFLTHEDADQMGRMSKNAEETLQADGESGPSCCAPSCCQ